MTSDIPRLPGTREMYKIKDSLTSALWGYCGGLAARELSVERDLASTCGLAAMCGMVMRYNAVRKMLDIVQQYREFVPALCIPNHFYRYLACLPAGQVLPSFGVMLS